MISIPGPPISSARHGMRLLRHEPVRTILAALAMHPMTVGDLCAQLMLESDTTLREQLDLLERFGVIERRPGGHGRAGLFRLTAAGADLRGAARFAGRWLSRRPGHAPSPQSEVAWRALAALGDAWELSLIQRLVLRPSTSAELTGTIPTLGKEKTKRMLRRLRGAGLLRVRDGSAPARYALTAWGRRAIAVLATIAAWERNHLGGTAEPVAAFDGAVALLASLPLISVAPSGSGICSFTVTGGSDSPGPRAAVVWARMAGGRVTACRLGPSPAPPAAWVVGGIDGWLEAVTDARPQALRTGGDRTLVGGAIIGLHQELFGELRS